MRENNTYRSVLSRHKRRLSSLVDGLRARNIRQQTRGPSDDYLTLASSSLFSPAWYLLTYSDVAAAKLDPIQHYLDHGAREGRQPGPDFNSGGYLEANPDVAASGLNPLVHFIKYGRAEGRKFSVSVILPATNPTYWYFIGDSVDWLKAKPSLTGVGRVSTELFFAAIENSSNIEIKPCVFGDLPSGIVTASATDHVQYLSDELKRPLAGRPTAALAVEPRHSPLPGDHVFFTGLVWGPAFAERFKHLKSLGIRFSVLVHDIIPIENPDLVGPDYFKMFTEWMVTVLQTATVIYVSNDHVKQKIARFALLQKIQTVPTIVTITFGLRRAIGQQDSTRGAETAVIPEGQEFVLCVGTIDKRKNQLFLCRLWAQLAERLDDQALPLLVLAGRDDLKIAEADGAMAPLFARGKIRVLENLTDAEIADLYRRCLFTAFPSLSEGYGLPVVESLSYGKLCLTSDLPEIQANGGDFAWYFSTDDTDGAIDLFTRALGDQAARREAEDHILRDFVPAEWRDTFLDMLDTVPPVGFVPPPAGTTETGADVTFPGAQAYDTAAAFTKAARYCTDRNPDVSILIINWNAASLTLECIRQISSQTDSHTYEIIIADNGSAPDDVAKLRNLGPGIRLLELGRNRYFGEANNIAAEAAQGRYLCLLNNDAFVRGDWLTALITPLQTDPRVGATGPLFLYPDETIQEAGGIVDPGGYPIRFGRGEQEASAEILRPKFVDYISAAALLVPRDIFMAVGGFDLAYEPAYYEDTDLCLKIQALGHKVLYCPDARVVHIEGSSANGDAAATARRTALGDLNRDKFTARWGDYLKTRRQAHLRAVRQQFLPSAPLLPPMATLAPGVERPRAVVYTPYELTPGGGERFLLTLAMTLSELYDVTVVTPWRYSRLRLRNLGCEFNLDLSRLDVMIETEFAKADAPDLMVTLGNHIIPTAPARGKTNVYICQFPYPLGRPVAPADRETYAGYQKIIVYSHYTRAHIFANLSAYQLPDRPVEVLYPPVPLIQGEVPAKKRMILTVGRFFVGGHSKRHDVLIDVFKKIAPQFSEPVELHVAGSSMPGPEHMDYLAKIRAAAEGHPIHLHVNVSADALQALYRDTAIYWHGTGIGADLNGEPGKAEHFGITVLEAMSAQAVPFALNSGGPREIIADGQTGFLYDSPDTLAEKTLALLSKPNADQLKRMGTAARARAQMFSQDAFAEGVRALVDSLKPI